MYKNYKGYKSLAFFKQAEIIYDFTMEFCQRYIDNCYKNYKSYKFYSRQSDQMIQAARSGKQNISEGYAQEDWKGKDKLLRISRGSFEELLQDYQDFLRQKGLKLWERDSSEAKEVRNLVYKIKDHNGYNYYKIYLDNPQRAANAMICLVNQTNMMLNQKIRWNEENLTKEDVFSPKEKWLKMQMEKRMEEDRKIDEEFQKLAKSMKK
jgi:restriction system protein